MPLRMRAAVRRRLVEAHCVREAGLEEVVVAGGQTFEGIGQAVPFLVPQFRQSAKMAARDQERLERPDCPPRHKGDKMLILKNDALSGCLFSGNVFAQEAATGERKMVTLSLCLGGRFVGHKTG